MPTPAEVSRVFCNTVHGCGSGSTRSFFRWSWRFEPLPLLVISIWSFHVSLLLMWSRRHLTEMTVLRIVPWRLYFAYTGLVFLVKVTASHLDGLNSISQSFSHCWRLSRSDWSVLMSCSLDGMEQQTVTQQTSALWDKCYLKQSLLFLLCKQIITAISSRELVSGLANSV